MVAHGFSALHSKVVLVDGTAKLARDLSQVVRRSHVVAAARKADAVHVQTKRAVADTLSCTLTVDGPLGDARGRSGRRAASGYRICLATRAVPTDRAHTPAL